MIKNFLDSDDEQPPPAVHSETPPPDRQSNAVIGLFGTDAAASAEPSPANEEPFLFSGSAPESTEENIRRSGLAWSMGVVFFSAVVFMLILGWGADLLFGSSPWGMVVGIVIGALIGFYQLFRLSSQMFQK